MYTVTTTNTPLSPAKKPKVTNRVNLREAHEQMKEYRYKHAMPHGQGMRAQRSIRAHDELTGGQTDSKPPPALCAAVAAVVLYPKWGIDKMYIVCYNM